MPENFGASAMSIDEDQLSEGRRRAQEEHGSDVRIRGVVTRIFPSRGYIWICGEDAVDYFGHITNVRGGVPIENVRIDQECTFVPIHADRGPKAISIVMKSYA
jgi:hypothetical protein